MLPILSNEITQHPYGDAFGGIVPIMEQIGVLLAQTIDSTLGGDVHGMPVRSTKALIYRGGKL